MAFFLSTSHFIVACSTSIWYFNRKERQATHPVLMSVWWMVRYHIGSIAFGSLILAIVYVIRITAQYIHEKFREEMNQDNNINRYISCLLLCFINCLERFIKFFNKHAYVEIALRSTNFCTSAGNGMKVVQNNFLKFGILHGLGEIVMNIVILFIVMIGTFIGYLLIVVISDEKTEFNGTAGSLVVVALITLGIASLFGHIWEVSSDSIMHCHCLDEELSGGRPRNSTGRIEEALSNRKHAGYV